MLLDQIINNYRLQFYSQFFQRGKEGKLERLLHGEINLVYVIQNLKKKFIFFRLLLSPKYTKIIRLWIKEN